MLFLACQVCRPRQPERTAFALYDTFAPTALKGKAVFVEGPGGDLTATIALELARAGARVAVHAPLDEGVQAMMREAQVLGRRVIAAANVEEAVKAFGGLDALVNLGEGGAYLAHAAAAHLNGGAMMNVVPRSGWERFKPEELRKALFIEGIRANAIGIPDAGTNPQDVAQVAVFLASDAGRYVTGQCIPVG